MTFNNFQVRINDEQLCENHIQKKKFIKKQQRISIQFKAIINEFVLTLKHREDGWEAFFSVSSLLLFILFYFFMIIFIYILFLFLFVFTLLTLHCEQGCEIILRMLQKQYFFSLFGKLFLFLLFLRDKKMQIIFHTRAKLHTAEIRLNMFKQYFHTSSNLTFFIQKMYLSARLDSSQFFCLHVILRPEI